MMKLNIEIVPSRRIAYFRSIGPYGPGNARTMERMKEWAGAYGLFRDDSVLLGIARDNPETTKPEDCRYDACVVLPDHCYISDGEILQENLTGGAYAVFQVEHTAEAIQKAWLEIFPEIFRLGHQPDESRPILERYAVAMVNRHLCEICVPIR